MKDALLHVFGVLFIAIGAFGAGAAIEAIRLSRKRRP